MNTIIEMTARLLTPKIRNATGIAALALASTACVNSPLPAGATAALYTWENRDEAVTSRTALNDGSKKGFYTGDFLFGNALKTNPELADRSGMPMVIEACEETVCYNAVVFPEDYKSDKWGLIVGSVSLTGLSTAMYHQVKDLPASEVRARLEELTSLVTADGIDSVSYVALISLDIRRVESDREYLLDESLAQAAGDLVAQGEKPTLMSLVNANAKKTSELTASREFAFSDSWDLSVDVDISSRITVPSYLMICHDFQRIGSGYTVAYDNCALKTDLVEGRFESTLRMTGTTRELLVTVMRFDAPDNLEQTIWVRDASTNTLKIR